PWDFGHELLNPDLEHIAALELLALVMAADRTLSPSEIEAIRDISSEWRDDTTENSRFERYLGPAVERAQAAIADDSIVELIDDIDGRISSRVLRMALFSAAREVAGVDDGISPEEGTILAEVAVRFG
ncbi:MAG: TerB family tellurite resistance protein, partial [Ilumatobacteraceae bacterium]